MEFPQPHTGSYYAATQNLPTGYAPLEGDQHADVCVVGAGFSGISTALHLAERGYAVHVVEANQVGWGATGRNGGQIIGGISGEEQLARNYGEGGDALLWDLRWAGHDIIRQRVQKYSIKCDLKWGYLDVAIKPRHLRAMEAEVARMQRYEFPHEYRQLDKSETAELIGTEAYIGSLLNMGNGHLHPLNLCVGEARAAVALGATIYEQSPVLKINPGKKAVVETARGRVHADTVVLAGNAYHNTEKRLKNYLFPVQSFIVATEPLSTELVAEINPQDLAVCDPNFLLEYFRLSADKRLLFGGRVRHFGDDVAFIRKRLGDKMRRVYPQLEKQKIAYAWTGCIGVTLNRVPQLGRLEPNVFFSQGYSGHGVNVTHLAGQIMADAVAGTMERFDVFASIPPLVVPGSRALRRPLTELGLMYYKMRDKM